MYKFTFSNEILLVSLLTAFEEEHDVIEARLTPGRKESGTVTKQILKSQHTAKVELEDFLTSISEKPPERLLTSTKKVSPITVKEIEHIEPTEETVIEDISKSQAAGIETAKVAIKRLLTTISEEPTEDLVIPERKNTKDVDAIKEIITKDILTSQDSDTESTKVVLEDILASISKDPREHLLIPAKKDSKDVEITKETVTKDISELPREHLRAKKDSRDVKITKETVAKDISELQDASIKDAKQKSKLEYKSHYATDEWNYTKINHQVEATKKGLDKVNYFFSLL